MDEMHTSEIRSFGVFLWAVIAFCLAGQDIELWIRRPVNILSVLFFRPLLFAVCHEELDLSEELGPRWQPDYQDSCTAFISGGAQDEQ